MRENEFLKERKKAEMVEITTKDILNILVNPKFSRALFIASRENKRSGYETGFTVHINKDKHPVVGHVLKGGVDNLGESGMQFLTKPREEPEEDQHEATGSVVDLHFHPNAHEVIDPSLSDIKHLAPQHKNKTAIMAV